MKYINEAALIEDLGDGDPSVESLRVLQDLSVEWQMACNKVFSKMGDITPSSLRDILSRIDDFEAVKGALELFERLLKLSPDLPLAEGYRLPVIAPLSRDNLADAFAKMESRDLRVATIFLNARDYADIRKYSRDEHHAESRPALLKLGFMGTLWAALVITSRSVPAGTVWFVAEGGNLLPTKEQAEDPLLGQVLVGTSEGRFNPYGVVELAITR